MSSDSFQQRSFTKLLHSQSWSMVGRITLEVLLLVYTLVLLILGDSYLKWFLWGLLGLGWLIAMVVRWWQKKNSFHEADKPITAFSPMINRLYLFFALWIVWSGVSLWWSHYVPLGLARLTQIMTGVIALEIGRWLAAADETQTLNPSRQLDALKRFALGMTLLGWVLALGAVFFMIFPIWAQLLPGFNILVATYGHNHVAAFFILALPVQLWFTTVSLEEMAAKLSRLQAKNQKNKWLRWQVWGEVAGLLLMMTIPVLILATSFGRVAMTVGSAQLLGWLVALEKVKIDKNQSAYLLQLKQIIRRFVIILVGVLGVVLISMLFVSFYPKILPDSFCKMSAYKTQVCKAFLEESRWAYWRQGWESFSDRPLTGYGLGTFSLVSLRYRLTSWQATSYAHNEYWSQFIETGVAGGMLFFGLMASVIWLLIKNVWSLHLLGLGWQKRLLVVSLVISWLGMMVNVFFDFDWSFSGLWFLSWVMMGMMIGTGKTIDIDLKQDDLTLLKSRRWLYWFLILVASWLITLMGLYGVVEVALGKGWHGWVARHASIFVEHTVLLAKSDKLSKEDKEILFEKHEMYPKMVELASNNKYEKKWLRQLLQIDPWSVIIIIQNNKEVLPSLDNGELKADTEDLVLLLEKHTRLVGENRVSYQTRQVVADYLLRLAEVLLNDVAQNPSLTIDGKKHTIEIAAGYIQTAQRIDEWALANTPFLGMGLEDEDLAILVGELSLLPSKAFGKTGELWKKRLFARLEQEFKSFDPVTSPQQITIYSDLVLVLQPWQNWAVWELTSQQYETLLVEKKLALPVFDQYRGKWQQIEKNWRSLSNTQLSEVGSVIEGWNDVFEVVADHSRRTQTKFNGIDDATMQLGYMLMAYENALVAQQEQIDFDRYKLAWERNPYDIQQNKDMWWISTLDIKKKQHLPVEEVIEYLNDVQLGSDPSKYAWLVKEHQGLIAAQMQQAFMRGDSTQLEQLQMHYQALPYLDMEMLNLSLEQLFDGWKLLDYEEKSKLLPRWHVLLTKTTRNWWSVYEPYQEQIVAFTVELVQQNDPQLIEEGLEALTQTYQNIDDMDQVLSYQSKVAVTKNLQRVAITLIQQPYREENWKLAERATILMQRTLPNDYVVMEQYGNLYVAWAYVTEGSDYTTVEKNYQQSLLKKAEDEYKKCLDRFASQKGQSNLSPEEHTDCRWALQDVYRDPPYQQYEDVGEIIVQQLR